MALFTEEDRQGIKKILDEKVKGQIHVDLFIDENSEECPPCEALVQIFEELHQLDQRLLYTVHDTGLKDEAARKNKVDCLPAILFNGQKEGRLLFYGVPSGYEFSTLLETLGALSGRESSFFTPEMKDYLQSISSPVHFKVFVTPRCPYCPQAALTAFAAAKLNKKITAEVYEVSEFPETGKKYQVENVPKTVINDSIHIIGGYPEKGLKEKLEELFS
ncbi:MAG TPA: glutaredoxin [Firmicutes bacterium]|nr:glutaredoxin [Bacillota bacterium]